MNALRLATIPVLLATRASPVPMRRTSVLRRDVVLLSGIVQVFGHAETA